MTKEELQESKMMAEEIAWTHSLDTPIDDQLMEALHVLIGKDRFFEIMNFRTRNITAQKAVEILKNKKNG